MFDIILALEVLTIGGTTSFLTRRCICTAWIKMNAYLQLVSCLEVLFMTKLVVNEKSYLWSWEVGWVSYASKWAYGSIFSAYVSEILNIQWDLLLSYFGYFGPR